MSSRNRDTGSWVIPSDGMLSTSVASSDGDDDVLIISAQDSPVSMSTNVRVQSLSIHARNCEEISIWGRVARDALQCVTALCDSR